MEGSETFPSRQIKTLRHDVHGQQEAIDGEQNNGKTRIKLYIPFNESDIQHFVLLQIYRLRYMISSALWVMLKPANRST